MRHHVLVLAAACLSVTANAQNADPSVQVTAPKAAATTFMDPSAFQDYKRVYYLSDGQTMRFTNMYYAMYAQIGDGVPHRMASTGKGSFQTLDHMIEAKIILSDDGEASGTVSYVPERTGLASAGAAPVTVALASR